MTGRCPHCRASIPKTPSRALRLATVAGAWLVVLVMVAGLGLASLFAVPIVPIVLIAGTAIIGGAHQYAFGDRICYACGRAYELDGERVEPVAAEATPAPAFAT